MELKEKGLTKLGMAGLLAAVVLGLAGCNGREANQDSPTGAGSSSNESVQSDLSVFDDFPEWWQDSMTEREKQIFLDTLTPEELGELREQAEGWGESGPPIREGAQQIIIGPEEGTEGGAFMMTEDGMIEVDLDEMDLETEIKNRWWIKEVRLEFTSVPLGY